MRVAFYAPLKPPDSPVPSGDRRIARLLIKALELGGHEVELLSRFRAFEGGGDAVRMGRLGVIGRKLAARCIRRIEAMPAERRPQAVFTYHVYDKAPDWIGPMVAQALRIPYLICEASLNPARAKGAMAIGHKAAKATVAAADIILELKSSDRKGVEPALKPGAAIWDLPPFIDVAALEPRPGGEGRAGDTTATFKQALADLAVSVLEPIATDMRRLNSDPGHIDGVLCDGATRARAIAAPILRQVKEIVGFVQD